MMNWAYGMMGGYGGFGAFSLLGFLFWAVLFIDSVLLGIWLWKQIQRR